jgi:hypothetical protein
LYTFRESAEIAHALEFVVGQLDVKMLLEAREQIERLETIDAELLEEIVAGAKLLARHLEVLGSQLQNLIRCFFDGVHASPSPDSNSAPLIFFAARAAWIVIPNPAASCADGGEGSAFAFHDPYGK